MNLPFEFCLKTKDKSSCENFKKMYYVCKDSCLFEDNMKEIEQYKYCLKNTKNDTDFIACKFAIKSKLESNFSRCAAACDVQYFDNLTS
jgi:hypothetical protein